MTRRKYSTIALALLILPCVTAEANAKSSAPSSLSRTGSLQTAAAPSSTTNDLSSCTTSASGACTARPNSGNRDLCKTGNCGLEYKSRGSHSSGKSVLKMSRSGGRHGRHRYSRGKGSYRRHRR